MNDLQLLKEEIFNCSLIVPLLESLGCEINERSLNKERIEASLPDGDNFRSVQVYQNEFLTSRIRTRSHMPIRDVIDLVSYLKFNKETSHELDNCIGKSKRYIIDTLGLTQFKSNNYNMQDDPNDWLKKIRNKRKKRINLDEIEPNPILPESVLDEFVQLPHIIFLEDGITYETQREFEIGFDLQSERVTIPIRDKSGSLIGVKGRATKEDDEEQYKYLPIYAYQKSKVWFNLHRALPYILEKGEVICLESEKSCMKAHDMGYFNTVSQQGSDITQIQAAILRRLSPDIKIILAYDQDIQAKEVQLMARVFGKYENLYGMIDMKGLLDHKQAPVDSTKEIWEELYRNHCYKIFPK